MAFLFTIFILFDVLYCHCTHLAENGDAEGDTVMVNEAARADGSEYADAAHRRGARHTHDLLATNGPIRARSPTNGDCAMFHGAKEDCENNISSQNRLFCLWIPSASLCVENFECALCFEPVGGLCASVCASGAAACAGPPACMHSLRSECAATFAGWQGDACRSFNQTLSSVCLAASGACVQPQDWSASSDAQRFEICEAIATNTADAGHCAEACQAGGCAPGTAVATGYSCFTSGQRACPTGLYCNSTGDCAPQTLCDLITTGRHCVAAVSERYNRTCVWDGEYCATGGGAPLDEAELSNEGCGAAQTLEDCALSRCSRNGIDCEWVVFDAAVVGGGYCQCPFDCEPCGTVVDGKCLLACLDQAVAIGSEEQCYVTGRRGCPHSHYCDGSGTCQPETLCDVIGNEVDCVAATSSRNNRACVWDRERCGSPSGDVLVEVELSNDGCMKGQTSVECSSLLCERNNLTCSWVSFSPDGAFGEGHCQCPSDCPLCAGAINGECRYDCVDEFGCSEPRCPSVMNSLCNYVDGLSEYNEYLFWNYDSGRESRAAKDWSVHEGLCQTLELPEGNGGHYYNTGKCKPYGGCIETASDVRSWLGTCDGPLFLNFSLPNCGSRRCSRYCNTGMDIQWLFLNRKQNHTCYHTGQHECPDGFVCDVGGYCSERTICSDIEEQEYCSLVKCPLNDLPCKWDEEESACTCGVHGARLNDTQDILTNELTEAEPVKLPNYWDIPTPVPSTAPTILPTASPTRLPSPSPTHPTSTPSAAPTSTSTTVPTLSPTRAPTTTPTKFHTLGLSDAPTSSPSKLPTTLPPSSSPLTPTISPTISLFAPTMSQKPAAMGNAPTNTPTNTDTSATAEPNSSPTSSTASPVAFRDDSVRQIPPQVTSPEDSTGVIIGAVFGVLVCIVTTTLAVCFFHRRSIRIQFSVGEEGTRANGTELGSLGPNRRRGGSTSHVTTRRIRSGFTTTRSSSTSSGANTSVGRSRVALASSPPGSSDMRRQRSPRAGGAVRMRSTQRLGSPRTEELVNLGKRSKPGSIKKQRRAERRADFVDIEPSRNNNDIYLTREELERRLLHLKPEDRSVVSASDMSVDYSSFAYTYGGFEVPSSSKSSKVISSASGGTSKETKYSTLPVRFVSIAGVRIALRTDEGLENDEESVEDWSFDNTEKSGAVCVKPSAAAGSKGVYQSCSLTQNAYGQLEVVFGPSPHTVLPSNALTAPSASTLFRSFMSGKHDEVLMWLADSRCSEATRLAFQALMIEHNAEGGTVSYASSMRSVKIGDCLISLPIENASTNNTSDVATKSTEDDNDYGRSPGGVGMYK